MRSLVTLYFILTAYVSICQTNTFPSSGNVGIGVSNPTSDLQINGTTRTNNLMVGQTSLNDNTGTVTVKMGRASGDKAALWLTDNSAKNSLTSGGSDGVMLSVQSSSITNSVMVENGYSGIKSFLTGKGATYFGLGNLIYYGQTRGGINTDKYTFYSHAYNQYASNSNSTGFSSGGQLASTGQDVNTHTDFFAKNFDAMSNGTIGTRYGLHIAFNSTNITNAYGIYQSSDDVKNFFNGKVGIGTSAPVSKFDIHGIGTTTEIAFRVADNANVERLKMLDNGETVWQVGTDQEVKIGTNGFIYPGGSSIRTMYIRNAGSNLLEIAGSSIPTLRLGPSSYDTAIRGGDSTLNTPVFSIDSNFNAGLGFSNPSSGEIGVTLFYNDNVSTKAGFTLSSQGRWGMTHSPIQDDQLTQLLVRDDTTGEIKYRSASSLQAAGSPSPWTTTGSSAFYDAGNIGIGITNPQNKLDVNGTVHAREVKVDLNNWPDYVFDEDYSLLSLKELKLFIETNKHLPEVPTATEVETNGVMLGEMNKLLLKKIEEMTLYMIEMKNEIEVQKTEIDDLKNRIDQP